MKLFGRRTVRDSYNVSPYTSKRNVRQTSKCKNLTVVLVPWLWANFRVDKYTQEFRWLVERSGWKKARVAEELAVSRGTVTDYWSGRTKPSLTVLRFLSRLTNSPLDLPGESTGQLAGTYLEKWEADLFATLRRLPSERRRRVIESIQTAVTAFDAADAETPTQISRRQPLKSALPGGIEATTRRKLEKKMTKYMQAVDASKAAVS